jgi:hypothetical protein
MIPPSSAISHRCSGSSFELTHSNANQETPFGDIGFYQP